MQRKTGKRFLILLTSFVMLLATNALPQDAQQDDHPTTHKQYSAYKRGTEKYPVVVKLLDSPDAEKNAAEHKKEAADKASNDVLLVIFTFGIFIVGIAQAALFFWQLRLIRQSLADAKSAADAAMIGAKAAQDSADALPKLEQSYLFMDVGIDGDYITGNIEQLKSGNGRDPWVRFTFTNYGKTPAIIKRISANLDVIMKDRLDSEIVFLDSEPIFGEYVVPSNKSFPTMEREITIPIINAQIVSEIQKGNIFFRFYGHAIYEDVFGKRHETAFFWLYNGVTRTFAPHNVQGKNYNRRT